jgi:hypothetical protein
MDDWMGRSRRFFITPRFNYHEQVCANCVN